MFVFCYFVLQYEHCIKLKITCKKIVNVIVNTVKQNNLIMGVVLTVLLKLKTIYEK